MKRISLLFSWDALHHNFTRVLKVLDNVLIIGYGVVSLVGDQPLAPI
jgi:hypothetical protein